MDAGPPEMQNHVVLLDGPPRGWWYDRVVPRALRHGLGRSRFRRFLAAERELALSCAHEVHEKVERLLALSAGELQLRGREIRAVAIECARLWQGHQQACGLGDNRLPDEGELVELLMNGFRSRGLILEQDQFPEAREAFAQQLQLQRSALEQRPLGSSTLAGWVAWRAAQQSASEKRQQQWRLELQRLLEFSAVRLPAAISEGAAWRWRNHLLCSFGLATAKRRLGLINSFYREAAEAGLLASNPFALLPPLQASALPQPPLDGALLRQLDAERSADWPYLLLRAFALRPRELAALRPLDFGHEQGLPVIWIRVGASAAARCLPVPEALCGFWQQAAGSGAEPIWQSCGMSQQQLVRRWAERLRRSSGFSATALRQERVRAWLQQGASPEQLRWLVLSRPGPIAPLAQLLPFTKAGVTQLKGVDPAALMLHCPTDPADVALSN